MSAAGERVPHPPRLVTFDFYTALVDYEATIIPALQRVFGDTLDASAVARAWRSKQLEWTQWSNSLARGRIPFRECTRRALVHVLARHGIAVCGFILHDLVAAWDRLVPWPEAASTLAAVKSRGYATAVLSNGDEAMLESGACVFDVAFDHILASDRAGYYKPHPAVYALPTSELGIAASDVLHVAGSGVDAMGAKLAGLRCAWSNRAGDPPTDADVPADAEFRDLSGLVAML